MNIKFLFRIGDRIHRSQHTESIASSPRLLEELFFPHVRSHYGHVEWVVVRADGVVIAQSVGADVSALKAAAA